MISSRTLALVLAASMSGCASQDLPGEIFEGTVEASGSVHTPLSKEPACVVGVKLWTRSNATKKGNSTHHRPEPRWAPGASLHVEGETLRLVGMGGQAGEPEFTHQGDQWDWDPSVTPRAVPEVFRGWGHDRDIESLVSAKIDDSYTHFQFTEAFTRCGETLKVRAERKGDTLELFDASPARSDEVLSFFGKLAMGFFLFLVLPIVGLIAFVIRRARRRS